MRPCVGSLHSETSVCSKQARGVDTGTMRQKKERTLSFSGTWPKPSGSKSTSQACMSQLPSHMRSTIHLE